MRLAFHTGSIRTSHVQCSLPLKPPQQDKVLTVDDDSDDFDDDDNDDDDHVNDGPKC